MFVTLVNGTTIFVTPADSTKVGKFATAPPVSSVLLMFTKL